MKGNIVTFFLTLALWFVFAGRVNIEVFLLGSMISSVISFMLVGSLFRIEQKKYRTKKFFQKTYYISLVAAVCIFDVFISAFRVSRHAFETKPSFSPRLVRMKTSLDNKGSLENLIHFMTITQGTLAMDFDSASKNYLIHWIDVHSDDEAEVKKIRINKHESLIAKIFE
ncbi:Na+/H+ antiporter subunit E [Bacillus sp. AK031]